MALPLSGQLSLGNIRTELGIPGVTNFSLINASIGNTGPYPPLNSYSFYKPSITPPEHRISEWYGYDHSIGYVIIDVTGTTYQCNTIDFRSDYFQNIRYYNKSGNNVVSPYNISINGGLALTVGSLVNDWNFYYIDDCSNTSGGNYITPTSVVITGTSTKVWVDGTGFL
jgi:hypothetical protein